NLNRIEDPTPQEEKRFFNIEFDITGNIGIYEQLKTKIDTINLDFANVARAYRSPIHQAFNDITQLYNEIKGEVGTFAAYSDVSIYIHGIESTGSDFFESAKNASQEGDLIVYENRNGVKKYLLVT